jgi:xylono-1,5-lactonase
MDVMQSSLLHTRAQPNLVMDLRCIWPVSAHLGEGPVWVAEQQRLYFVDIFSSKLHALQFDRNFAQQQPTRLSWDLPEPLCWLVPCASTLGQAQRFVAGFQGGIAHMSLEPLLRVEALQPVQGLAGDVRLNDAKLDTNGRIWAGSMHRHDYSKAVGRLHCFDKALQSTVMDTGYHICNGPCFSIDGRTMYHNDSYTGSTYTYSVSPDGCLGPRQLWRQFNVLTEGAPDGMTVDAKGCLWIAHWGAGRVCRYDPHAQLLQTIELPITQPSSCAFGGHDLSTLFITSAREGMSAEQLNVQPLAGGLFAVRCEIPGTALPRYQSV